MTVIQPMNVPRPLKLTLDDFDLLNRAGAFDGYAKSELIDGVIYTMNAQYRRHSFAKNELNHRLRQKLEAMDSHWVSQSEATIAMPPDSLPEPDICLTSEPKGEDYIPLHSVPLAIEIADSSAHIDLGAKAALYARHGVPEYWVVEIPAGTIHQFWEPSALGYGQARSIKIGERIESVTIAGLAVETDGLI